MDPIGNWSQFSETKEGYPRTWSDEAEDSLISWAILISNDVGSLKKWCHFGWFSKKRMQNATIKNHTMKWIFQDWQEYACW